MRHRTGSIDQPRPGRHRARVTLGTGRRVTVGVFVTREEAETRLASALDVMGDDPAATLAEHVEAWIDRREIAREIEDVEGARSILRTHIVGSKLGELEIERLRRSDVVEWIAGVRATVAAQTARNVLGVVRGALGAALDAGLVAVNVAAGIRVRGDKRTSDPWTYLTPAEQAALVAAVGGPERHLVAFAIGSGLRAGELCTLRLADAHEDRVVVRYGKVPAAPTKGGRVRVVPLVGPARAALKAWLAELPAFASENPHGLAFPRSRGGFRDAAHVLPWRALFGDAKTVGAVERASITRNVRWHDLRHTCASSLVSGWWGRRWSLEEVRGMLGHTSITTTQRYAHLADDALALAARATPGSSGGETAPNRSVVVQDPEIARVSTRFLNRWSQVRFSPGAPNDSGDVDAGGLVERGRLVADCVAFLEAVARGDEDAVGTMVDGFRGASLRQLIEIAGAVLEADAAARECAS